MSACYIYIYTSTHQGNICNFDFAFQIPQMPQHRYGEGLGDVRGRATQDDATTSGKEAKS